MAHTQEQTLPVVGYLATGRPETKAGFVAAFRKGLRSGRRIGVAKIAKPTVETSVKVRLNLEKFVWSSRKK